MLLPWSILTPTTDNRAERRRGRGSSARRRNEKKKPWRAKFDQLEDRIAPAVYYVDVTNPNAGSGSLIDPFKTIQQAVNVAGNLDEIIIYGNTSTNPNDVYVWRRDGDQDGNGIADGNLVVRPGVSMTFLAQNRAGNPGRIIVKMQNNILDVQGAIDVTNPSLPILRGQLRVLGTAEAPVIFTSYQDDTAGGDTNGDGTISQAQREDWGGIRFQAMARDQDISAASGSLIQYADIRFTGQTLFDAVSSQTIEFASIRMEGETSVPANDPNPGRAPEAAVVRVWDTIFRNGGKALDVHFRSLAGNGPDVGGALNVNGATSVPHRITFQNNTVNGLFVNIPFVPVVAPFSVASRWDDVGVPYVITQRIIATQNITIDQGMIIKVQREEIDFTNHDRFDTERQFQAVFTVNGAVNQPVLFTSIKDDEVPTQLRLLYDNGSADTNNDGSDTTPDAGDWGGITVSRGNVDHAIIRYAGGEVPIDGVFQNRPALAIVAYNVPERTVVGTRQDFRVSNTLFTRNLGTTGIARPAIYVEGTGRITIIDNTIRDNRRLNGTGAALAILATSNTFNAYPHQDGGYGTHYRRNVISGNLNNGVFADSIGGHGYIEDSDIVLTIGNQITVEGIDLSHQSIVRQIMSKRTVLPVNPTDGSATYLNRYQGDATQEALFLTAIQGQGALPHITNPVSPSTAPFDYDPDNDYSLFHFLVTFEQTSRLQSLPGATVADPGNIRGEEWRDWGVDFLTSEDQNNQLFPFKVLGVGGGNNILTTAKSNDDGTFDVIFPNFVQSVGFYVRNNLSNTKPGETAPSESIEFYGDQNQLLERIPLPTTASGPIFVGRISRAPIYRIRIVENANDGDVMGIDTLRYVDAAESTVIKMAPGAFIRAGSPVTDGTGTKFTAFDGWDYYDRDVNNPNDEPLYVLGPTLRIMGQPEVPVRITALDDDSTGAGIRDRFGVDQVQRDTNGDGVSAGEPGSWAGITIHPGVNTSKIEFVTQEPGGAIVRTSSDSNPYTIGDNVSTYLGRTSIPDTLNRRFDDSSPTNPTILLQDGTLIEHSDIRYAFDAVNNQGYPHGKLHNDLTENEDERVGIATVNDRAADSTGAGTYQTLVPFGQTSHQSVRMGGRLNNADLDSFRLANWTSTQGSGFAGQYWSYLDGLPNALAPTPIDGRVQSRYIPVYFDLELTAPTGAPAAQQDPLLLWGFNSFGQLVYSNYNLQTTPLTFVGGFREIEGDWNANFADDPLATWDVEYVVLSRMGHYPAVVVPAALGGRRADTNTTIFQPISNPPDNAYGAAGYRIQEIDQEGNLVNIGAFTDFINLGIPPIEFPNYEMELRLPTYVNGNDIHLGASRDASRPLDGDLIIRQNNIREFANSGITMRDLVFDDVLGQRVVPMAGRWYFDSPRVGFSNTGQYVPGPQVYNNVISFGSGTSGGLGNGIVLTEDALEPAPRVTVPTAYTQILNNTIHGNARSAIELTTRGGPNVINNIMTSNGVSGVSITDLGQLLAPDPVTVVNYNIFFNNPINIQGTFNGGNNLINQNPLYVDAPNSDFRVFARPAPGVSSPAVDAALSNLADRLFQSRTPDVPTRMPNDDFRDRRRNDNPHRQNVGSGQFAWYDIGAYETNEAPLRVVAVDPFFTSTRIVPGPVSSFTITFAGRVDPSTVVLQDNPNTVIDEQTIRVTNFVSGAIIPITSFTQVYDRERDLHVFTFTFATPLADGQYCVLLDGTVTTNSPGGIRDIAGSLLDGEFTSPGAGFDLSFPSGNGVSGGDFVYCPFTIVTSSIGDLVWNDANGNRNREPAEPGIGNVRVILTWAGPDGDLNTTGDNVTFPEVRTSAAGIYGFTQLRPGVYSVFVDPTTVPSNFVLTTPPNPRVVTVGLGEAKTDVDFGFWQDLQNARIGDLVFDDANGNGVRDANEPGLAGIKVDLIGTGPDLRFNSAANPSFDDVVFPSVFTTTTGSYLFQNLPAWGYRVSVDATTLPTGFFRTTPLVSPLETFLLPGQQFLTADFGFQQRLGQIGDFVWNDVNANGVQDVGEPGIQDVDLNLYQETSTPGIYALLATTRTDSDGFYQFLALAPGNYRVDVVLSSPPLAGFFLTNPPDQKIVNLPTGTTVLNNVDFGFAFDPFTGSMGGKVFRDDNANKVQDGSEPVLPNVAVALRWAGRDQIFGNGDDLVFNGSTDALGQYSFANLPVGRYRVDVDQNDADLPAGAVVTTANDPFEFSLPVGGTTAVDFGFQVRLAQIGDLVFNDVNGNGIFDPGAGNPEAGINGVRVNLVWAGPDGDFNTTSDNVTFPTRTTAGGGLFNFNNLAIGNYLLTVDTTSPVLTGYSATTPNPLFIVVTAADQVITNADFGFQLRTSSIGDIVFFDANQDGIRNAGEFGIPNVRVFIDVNNNTIYDPGIDQAAITNTNGLYSFANLPAGQYRVRVDPSTLPVGSTPTNPADLLHVVNLGQNQIFNDADFGILLPPSVTAGIFYFTLTPGGTLTNSDGSSVNFTTSDIVKLVIEPNGNVTYSIYFRGADVGLSGGSEAIDAFTFLPNGDIVLSIAGTGNVRQNYPSPGNGAGSTISVFGEDLLRFRPTQVNGPTAGSWSTYLSGRTRGLSGSSENVDAVAVLNDGRIIISTTGNVSAGGVTGKSFDLLAYNPATNKWAPFFKGNRVGLSTTAENVNALFIPDTSLKLPTLIMSTTGTFAANNGVSGRANDAFEFVPTSLEKIPKSNSVTKGTFNKTLAFNGNAFGLNGFNVTGMFLTTAPGPNPLQAAGVKGGAVRLTERVGRWTEEDGVVNVYVDASTFNDFQMARIEDALANVNDAWLPASGTQFVVVANPAQADVTIRGAAATAIGGKKQGVLGLTQVSYDVGISGWLPGGAPVATLIGHDLGGRTTVTIVNSWNWYVGADASGIGKKQFDFQSVVTHELGHAIGLTENGRNPNSVMYETLKRGQARREFTPGDRATIDQLYGQLMDRTSIVEMDDGSVSTPSAADDLAVLLTATGAQVVQPKTVMTAAGRTTTAADVTPGKLLEDVAVDRLFALQAKASTRLTAAGDAASLDEPWWNGLEG